MAIVDYLHSVQAKRPDALFRRRRLIPGQHNEEKTQSSSTPFTIKAPVLLSSSISSREGEDMRRLFSFLCLIPDVLYCIQGFSKGGFHNIIAGPVEELDSNPFMSQGSSF